VSVILSVETSRSRNTVLKQEFWQNWLPIVRPDYFLNLFRSKHREFNLNLSGNNLIRHVIVLGTWCLHGNWILTGIFQKNSDLGRFGIVLLIISHVWCFYDVFEKSRNLRPRDITLLSMLLTYKETVLDILCTLLVSLSWFLKVEEQGAEFPLSGRRGSKNPDMNKVDWLIANINGVHNLNSSNKVRNFLPDVWGSFAMRLGEAL